MDNYCAKINGGKYLCIAPGTYEQSLCEGFMSDKWDSVYCIFQVLEKDNMVHCHSMKAIRLLEESFNGKKDLSK
jgi:hypothetical protein